MLETYFAWMLFTWKVLLDAQNVHVIFMRITSLSPYFVKTIICLVLFVLIISNAYHSL